MPNMIKFAASFVFFFLILCKAEGEAPPKNGSLQLALTPPRGWNSYSSFSWIVSEAEFLDNAKFVSQHLLKFGYEYVVVDSLWYRKLAPGASVGSPGYDLIDEWGRPVPDPDRWPSSRDGGGLAGVAQQVHAMGLKFGIHVVRGISTAAVLANTPILGAQVHLITQLAQINTFASPSSQNYIAEGSPDAESGRPWRAADIAINGTECKWMKSCCMGINASSEGGRAFVKSLYNQYASWGVDYIKAHDCIFGEPDLRISEIGLVSKTIAETTRPMVYSLSPGVHATTVMGKSVSNMVIADDWDTRSPPPPSPPLPSPPWMAPAPAPMEPSPPSPPMMAPAPAPLEPPPPPPPKSIKKMKTPPPSFFAESAPDAPPPPDAPPLPDAAPPPMMCNCPTMPPPPHHVVAVVHGDPHFFGKHGERFDFHGKNNCDYCVVSDTNLQINMHVFQGIHKGSSFISKIGLVYEDYKILIDVHPPANETQKELKPSIVKINNVDLSKAHEYISQTTHMTVSYYPTYVHLRIPNTIDFNVTIMKPTYGIHGGSDYINFQMKEIKVSPAVHGILGQTYQETKEVYMKLHQARGMTPTQSTKIYVAGSDDDYLTSGIFATNCKFCKFEEDKKFSMKVKRALLLKAKRILSAQEDQEELVSGCAGVGNPEALCVTLIHDWLN